jgi:Fic family protein
LLLPRNERETAVLFRSVDVESLRGSPAGRLVRITGTDPRTLEAYDHFAFVPNPLPETVSLESRTWTSVTEAARSIGELRQVCAQLPNPQLLITPALAKEAQATSALEGTYGTLPDVLEARLPGFEPRTPELREINAYERMARLGFEWVQDREITIGMLGDLQRILAEASKRKTPEPGRVRTQQVIIGPEDSSVYDARFVPPPGGDQLRAGVEAWQRWVNEDHDLPVIVRAALAHYQFETLHPFNDCNGRVGRLVIILQLLRAGDLEDPALTLSPWLLRRRVDYQQHLLSLSRTGDWNPWVQFFCQALKEQCDSHVLVAKELLGWIQDLRRKLSDRHWTGTIADLSEKLIDWPIVTNRWVVETQRVSAPTAQRAIDRLVELGALKELTGGRYGRVYGAIELMNLVDSL